MASVAGILRAAADQLEICGWIQRVDRDDNGRTCATQAIWQAAVTYGDYVECANTFQMFLGGGPIWKWNDAPGRTVDEVLNALRKCADEHGQAR